MGCEKYWLGILGVSITILFSCSTVAEIDILCFKRASTTIFVHKGFLYAFYPYFLNSESHNKYIYILVGINSGYIGVE